MSKSKKKSAERKTENVADVNLMLLKVQRDNLALKLGNVGRCLVREMPERWRVVRGIGQGYNAADLSNEVLLQAVTSLVKQKKDNWAGIECRLAKAEETVTLLTCKCNKLSLKCAAYENGLKEIVKSEDLTYIKDKVATLKVIAGEKCNNIDCHNEMQKDLFRVDGVTNRQDDHASRAFDNMNKLQIIPPAIRLPSETKLEDVDTDLMILIVKEMNQERVSYADWRMLAKLIGVECEKIALWLQMNIKNPAQMVIDEWIKKDDTVTIHHLYNHLISPAIRNTLLCKVIQSYYDVL